MTAEVVLVTRKFRRTIPDAHRGSMDTRLKWLWHQRFGTVQQIWKDSPDVLDHTAATLVLQAILAKDLDSMIQLFNRIEGGPLEDQAVADKGEPTMRV
jgi:hypothetical protein